MRALFPGLSHFLRMIGLTPREETKRQVERVREPEPVCDVPIHEEIVRARALMCSIELTGVKFPVQLYDALEQARTAIEENRWTLQVDRRFYSTLSLLESIMRLRARGAAGRPKASDPSTRSAGNPGWTVIISNRHKVLDGTW